ncbi:MAG: NAD(P)/FAD-dependent oxidoreductase [Candidatus Manganitrophaceae bacterium]|nr:MAG: NAD(P)/FAD-dependent oxidoreductase [Candidatus Manganitrophaceae bacterium]
MTDYDVIVVGLGPAGAIAAYELSRRGHRVLAVDRSSLPRSKVCGGALTVRASALIPFDISGEVEQTIQGIRLNFCGKDPFVIETTEPVAYTVSRDRFDYLLASKAEAEGALLCDGVEVVEWKDENDEVTVRSQQDEWRCRYLIAAEGLNGLIRRGGGTPSSRGAVGVESEIPYQEVGQADHSLIQVDLGSAPEGFGWLLPKRDHHATGVSGAERKVKSAGELYGQFIENQGILKEASGQTVSVFQRIPSGEGTSLHDGNVLWVGDAAGLIDPLSGDGLYYALLTGLIAAEVISNNLLGEGTALSAYTARVRAETTEEFRVAHRFSRLFHRWPETSYRFLQSRKWVAELYFEILRGRERYSHIWPVIRKEWLRFAWRYWLTPREPRTQPLKQTTLGAFWRKGSELLFRRDRADRSLHPERRAHRRA